MATKKYSNDYEMVVSKDESGQEKIMPVYRGNYFEISLDQAGLVKFRKNSFLLLAAMVVIHITAGFLNNRGMYQFYISLPYVFCYLPLFYIAGGILRLPKTKRRYRREEVELSFERMKSASKILLILFGIGLIGEFTFVLFFSVQENNLLEYLYLALETLAAIAAFILIRLQRPVIVQTITEESSRE